jgi:hypothetical protein
MKPFTRGLLLLTGFAVPSALAAIFVFGCCILPFHKYLHGAMPLCHLASGVLAGHHDGDEHGADHPATPPPSRERLTSGLPSADNPVQARLFVTTAQLRHRPEPPRSDLRSFMAQGAVRCESDVGLHLLHTTFLI